MWDPTRAPLHLPYVVNGRMYLWGLACTYQYFGDGRAWPASDDSDKAGDATRVPTWVAATDLVRLLAFRPGGKEKILTDYLNDVSYGTVGGQTAVGVGAASQMFFNRSVSHLTLPQMALLAGLPQAPSEYNPFLYPELARNRRQQVLHAMVQSHYITQAQADAADAAPLEVHRNDHFATRNEPYVFDYVKDQLIQKFGLKAVERGWLTNRQIEAARVAMTRKIKRGGKVWINVFPDKPYTKKPAETRMGSGKGNPEGWVAVVKPGKVMFELAGVPEDLAREALRLAGHKLPVKTKFVKREGAEQ